MHETRKQSDPLPHACPACGATLRGPVAYCPNCGAALSGTTGRLQTDRVLAGRYRIARLIARGGMGAVYLAADMRLDGTPVAVKEMASDFVRGDTEAFAQAVGEFRREATMLARLRHPHLPRVSDQFDEGGKQYLVMEYIEGRTLREFLQQAGGRLPLDRALDYADQLCDVLAYLHSQQPPIIYRDLKPSNVMVMASEEDGVANRGVAGGGAPGGPRGGQLVLIDFGIARFYRPGRTSDTAIYGTIGYAPPEQYGQGQTDARTDIYALGVLLHQMMTGHEPATTPFALPPPRALNQSIPPHIATAIERATSNDRGARFADIAAFRLALRSAGDAAQPPVVRRGAELTEQAPRQAWEAATPAPRDRAARLPAWAAVGLVGTLLAGLLALVLLRPAGGASELMRPTLSPVRPLAGATTGPTPSPVPAVDSGGDGATPQGPLPAPLLLRPSRVSASSAADPGIDASGAPVTYDPQHAVDGRPDTTWRVAGDGAGQWLQLDFAADVSVQAIGIIPGYDKIDPIDQSDRFAQNRVVKVARFEFSDGTAVRASFTRQRDMQFVPLGGVRTRSVRIVIEETYPPQPGQTPRDFTPISEVQVQGTP